MGLGQALALVLGDDERRAHGVADLPAIERLPAPLAGDEGLEAGARLRRDAALGAQVVEEDAPDVGAAGLVELGEAQGDVDAGLEGVVEGADAVGG